MVELWKTPREEVGTEESDEAQEEDDDQTPHRRRSRPKLPGVAGGPTAVDRQREDHVSREDDDGDEQQPVDTGEVPAQHPDQFRRLEEVIVDEADGDSQKRAQEADGPPPWALPAASLRPVDSGEPRLARFAGGHRRCSSRLTLEAVLRMVEGAVTEAAGIVRLSPSIDASIHSSRPRTSKVS